MLKLSKDHIVDFNTYLDDLEYLGYVYVNRKLLDDTIERLYSQVETLAYRCKDIMACRSAYYYCDLSKKVVIKYLQQYENCPESMFWTKKSQSESLDAKKVLEPLIERGFAKEFLSTYIEYMSRKTVRENLVKMVERLEVSDKKDFKGEQLYKLYFSYEKKVNLRVYTKNYNIQGMPKECSRCLTAPEGYVIVSGDFKQSDLRIAYSLMLMSEENLPIMMRYDDKYEAMARILMGDKFDLEHFKTHRNSAYKKDSLAPIYGATSASTQASTEYVKAANRYLASCPNYAEYKRRLVKMIDLDLPVKVTSFFGNTQRVEASVGNYNKQRIRTEKLNFALNSPIQTGTSEIVSSVERSIMDAFAKVGATPENGGIYAYLNRHDELLFLLSTDYLEYSHIFQDHQIVQVDNWIPLEIEFSFSREYTKEDDEVQKLAERYYKPAEILPMPKYSEEARYIPAQDVLEVAVGICKLSSINKTVISYYDYIKSRVSYELCPSTDEDIIYQSVQTKLAINANNLKAQEDVNAMYVCTDLVLKDTSVFANIFIKFTPNYSSNVYIQAQTLAEYMAYKYCTREKIPFTMSPSLEASMDKVAMISARNLFNN